MMAQLVLYLRLERLCHSYVLSWTVSKQWLQLSHKMAWIVTQYWPQYWPCRTTFSTSSELLNSVLGLSIIVFMQTPPNCQARSCAPVQPSMLTRKDCCLYSEGNMPRPAWPVHGRWECLLGPDKAIDVLTHLTPPPPPRPRLPPPPHPPPTPSHLILLHPTSTPTRPGSRASPSSVRFSSSCSASRETRLHFAVQKEKEATRKKIALENRREGERVMIGGAEVKKQKESIASTWKVSNT